MVGLMLLILSFEDDAAVAAAVVSDSHVVDDKDEA